MRLTWKLALATLVVVGLAWAVYVVPTGELISAEGRRDTPLYDPDTVSGPWGSKPTILGTLGPGQRIQVVDCNPRKSDIDILVSYRGKIAVLGGGRGDFVLERTQVSLWRDGATTSCRGFFDAFDKAI